MNSYAIMTWAGWVLMAAAAFGVLYALCWDRSRGRRRCPKCWYDMSAVVGLRCPECGKSARTERSFQLTRRRWGFVAAALSLAIAGMAMRRWPHYHSRGWVAAVPDLILVYAVDPIAMGSDRGELASELEMRLENDVARATSMGCIGPYDYYVDTMPRWAVEIWARRLTTAVNNAKHSNYGPPGMLARRYDVRDLLERWRNWGRGSPYVPTEASMTQCIVDVVTSQVRAEHWIENGGCGACYRIVRGWLVVQTDAATHADVEAFLGAMHRQSSTPPPRWMAGLSEENDEGASRSPILGDGYSYTPPWLEVRVGR